ncbi:MAG: adenylate kinase [Candidatus Methylacidiphilales bacterium]
MEQDQDTADGELQSPESGGPVIVLLGGPGSGKGTHGRAVAEALRLDHVSTGDRFREEIQAGTSLGKRAQAAIQHGRFAPDDVASELLGNILAGRPYGAGLVLDGFPRTRAQAMILPAMLSTHGLTLRAVIHLALNDEEIIARLSGRLTCRACGETCHQTYQPPRQPGVCDLCGGELYRRADDEPETIRKRLAMFHETEGRLLEVYRSGPLWVEIDGCGPIEEVKARAIAAASSRLKAVGFRF